MKTRNITVLFLMLGLITGLLWNINRSLNQLTRLGLAEMEAKVLEMKGR